MINKRKFSTQSVWLIPIFILVAIMPLIYYLYSVPSSVSGNRFFASPYDFFNAAKSQWIIALAPLTLICSFFSQYSNKNNVKELTKEPVLYLISVYFLLVILSTIFSNFKDVAIYGINERYEGMIVILCYFCFWLAIFIQVRETMQVKFLLGCFYFYLFISFIIGFSQFIDKNILFAEFMKPFIASSSNSYLLDNLKFNFAPHYVFITLNNQNYVGTMMSMAMTICFSAYTVTTKNKFKLLHGFFACISFFLLIASTSRGGYIAAFVGIIFVFIALYRKILCNWKSTFVILCSFAVIFFIMNAYLDNVFINRFKALFSYISMPAMTVMASDVTTEPEKKMPLSDMKPTQVIYDYSFTNNEVKITFYKETFTIKVDGKQFSAYNDKGEQLEYKQIENENFYSLTTEGYEGFYISWDQKMLIVYCANSLFFNYDNGCLSLLTFSGENIYNTNPPVFPLLKGKESFFSNRGYIWSRSIPMIKDTVFLGHGPDTFLFYFPQYEYGAKMKWLGTPMMIVDKPHNMFIQTAINTGLISLISLLAAYAFYYIKLFKLIRKKGIENKWVVYSICIGATMAAYLVSGVANDSVIFIAPLFWVIFGLGCAMNRNAETLSDELNEMGLVD